MSRFRHPSPDVPVQVGERLEVIVDDIGEEGDGVTHIDGYTVFIESPGLVEGQEVQIEITDVTASIGWAKTV